MPGVNDFRQTEIYTSELPVPELRVFDFEMGVEKLKRHKSPCIDQIPAELIKARDRTFHPEIHKFFF